MPDDHTVGNIIFNHLDCLLVWGMIAVGRISNATRRCSSQGVFCFVFYIKFRINSRVRLGVLLSERVCVLVFVLCTLFSIWLHFLLQCSPKSHTPAALKKTAPSCKIFISLHVDVSHHMSLFLTFFISNRYYFCLPLRVNTNSFRVCLHPSELPFHMCTLRVCVRFFFVWNSAHAFVLRCENVNNDQYLCVHVALTRHCVFVFLGHHKLNHCGWERALECARSFCKRCERECAHIYIYI